MRRSVIFKAPVIAAICALFFGGSAIAQPGYGQGSQRYSQQGHSNYQPPAHDFRSQPPMRAKSISTSQLKNFVAARKKVLQIRQKYTNKLKKVHDQKKARRLQHEATQKMIGAVKAAGLDVKTYNNIALQIQRNPKLQKRLSKLSG